MITKAIVTGGAGFAGSNLVERLVDDGAEVLVIDDLSSGRLANLAKARASGRLTVHQMDIRAPELGQVFDRFRPEIVFHLAAQIDVRRSVADPVLDAEINVMGTVNVLDASSESGARLVVFVSSGGAMYGDADVYPTPESAPRRPESPYGVAKGIADEYLRYFHRERGLEFVSLGPANIYGPRQDPHGEAGVVAIFARQLLDGLPTTIYGDGSATRDFVFVEDVADACVRAAEVGGNDYLNIGSGVETSVLELHGRLSDLIGVKPKPTFAPAKTGDVARSCLDPSAAAKRLGWEAWTPLGAGLAQTVSWFRDNPSA